MILRGVHINVILTEIGLVAVVGVHAKERSDRTKTAGTTPAFRRPLISTTSR